MTWRTRLANLVTNMWQTWNKKLWLTIRLSQIFLLLKSRRALSGLVEIRGIWFRVNLESFAWKSSFFSVFHCFLVHCFARMTLMIQLVCCNFRFFLLCQILRPHKIILKASTQRESLTQINLGDQTANLETGNVLGRFIDVVAMLKPQQFTISWCEWNPSQLVSIQWQNKRSRRLKILPH